MRRGSVNRYGFGFGAVVLGEWISAGERKLQETSVMSPVLGVWARQSATLCCNGALSWGLKIFNITKRKCHKSANVEFPFFCAVILNNPCHNTLFVLN